METISVKTRTTLRSINMVIFLISVGEGIIAPYIPLLADSLGASYSAIGFLMTGFAVAYGTMSAVSGMLSDMLGKKRFLLLGIVFCFIASSGYCFAQTPAALLAFRTLEGMSRGILWVVLEAILADSTTFSNRSRETARFTTAYGIGAMLGCVIGGVLMEVLDLHTLLPVYPFFCVAGFLAAWRGIAEGVSRGDKPVEVSRGDKPVAEAARPRREALWLELKNIWPYCYVFFVYVGFVCSIWGLLSMVASYFTVSYLGIGLIFALFWGFRVISFLFSGFAAGKTGRKPVLLGGFIISSAAAAALVLGEGFWPLALASALGGAGTGILFTITITMVADSASPGHSGFAMGALEFAGSLGMISQTALSGLLGQYGGVKMTYSFTLLVCLLGIVIVGAFVKEKTGRAQRTSTVPADSL